MSIPLEVKIDASQINQMVADAILQSAIGKELEAIIKSKVGELSRSFDNPIEGVIRRHIQSMITDIVITQHGDKIKELITAKVNEKFTAELFEKLWRNFQA